MKAMKSEIKENEQGINSVDQKEERNIQPEQNEKKQEFKKMRRGLETSVTSLNIPTSKS